MRVRFWGTRGSIPTPGPRTAHFGGNTACVEIRTDSGTILVIDCGTGARELGNALLQERRAPLTVHLLISHTHWDHIQGFPFFEPAYVPDCTLEIYSPPGLEDTLEASLAGQMQYNYFPVRLTDLRACLRFHELGEGVFQVGDARVQTQYLNHTAPALGYRITAGGATVVYASDHEPFWWPGPAGGWPSVHPGDARHLAFLAGADLLIHDAQYCDEEYPAKRGWGHSTVEYVTDLAVRAGVRRLVLFHHDPSRDDRAVGALVHHASQRVAQQGGAVEVLAAAEGLELVLEEREGGMSLAPLLPLPRQDVMPRGARLLLAGGTADDHRALRTALAADGHRLLPVPAGQSAAEAVQQTRPALALLVEGPEVPDPLQVAAEIRATPEGEQLPIVVLASAERPGDAATLLAQATDVVGRPWSPPLLRSRVRVWLARTGAGRGRRQRAAARRGARRVTLQRVPALFRGLPAYEQEALLRHAAPRQFAAGEVLFREGDLPEGVFYLHEGAVRVTTCAPDGQEVLLAVLEPGDTVGELGVLDGGPRTATAIALRPTCTAFVRREAFLSGLAVAPRACLRLLCLLAARLRATDRRLSSLAFGELPARVARALLEAVPDAPALAAATLDALAERLGVDRPQLEHALLLLDAGGLVRIEGERVRVTDREGLLRFLRG
ncbi:MAG TPA: cyclic nucleotide-binding domain-containing protein [Chloroflexota bacterium]|nr:cyclic nucleotide-binding domain-containing protein [Chloroflexota bacterium]